MATAEERDVEEFTVSDLEFRARLAETWGHGNGREIVARAAMEWAEGQIRDVEIEAAEKRLGP